MKELILIEVPPPYDTESIDCDENNPNVDNIELWNEWLISIDYIQTNYDPDLHSTEKLEAKFGHRGVRIGEIGSHSYDWYYNIVMGYKIKKDEGKNRTYTGNS